tara:strand:- start:60 stop:419 length:360 start_codon:yes stop_codon:yes gene_type:complete
LEKKIFKECRTCGRSIPVTAASCEDCVVITIEEERRILQEKKQLLLEKQRWLDLQDNLAKCRDCQHTILPASKSCPTCGARYPNLSKKKYLRFEILKSVSIVILALMLFAAAALLKEMI